MSKETNKKPDRSSKSGQTMVLFAFLVIGLIGFVGLAVDVGFVFVRGTQLSKAIDSAVLAGVVEVEVITQLDDANLKAAQFLSTNLPEPAVYTSTLPANLDNLPSGQVTFTSDSAENDLGALLYTVTATWKVDLYFMPVLNFNDMTIQRVATAAYFPVTDIYASKRVEEGVVNTSTQAVFGPYICSQYGDPFSPFNPNWAGNDNRYDGPTPYTYRILIPGDYAYDQVRVELFDPDSINQPNNDGGSFRADVVHTAIWNAQYPGQEVESRTCSSNQKNPCLIDTREDDNLIPLGATIDTVNPWWFARVDENRGAGSAPGNGGCGQPSNYNPNFNTETIYTLSYFTELNDGTPFEVVLSEYRGQRGVAGETNHDTDLRWVSPDKPNQAEARANLQIDQSVYVPASSGVGTVESFTIDLTTDVPGILENPVTGDRFLYLDVLAWNGASENAFEIWAGPPIYVDAGIPSDVNLRNVRIIDDPGSHNSFGVTVFATGNLPLNSNVDNRVDIPLIYVPPEYAGQLVTVSLFDADSGVDAPVVFYFDTLGFTPAATNLGYDPNQTDWAMAFYVEDGSGGYLPDPDGFDRTAGAGGCNFGGSPSCNNQWIDPPFNITVPTYDAAACLADPTDQSVCTPFSGGRLTASYDGGGQDSYGWEIRLPGLPFLTNTSN